MGCEPNQLVKLTIRNVPIEAMENFAKNNRPLIISALYKFERNVTVMHYRIQRSIEFTEPVKKKTELLFQTGFRRFTAKPIWSVGKKRKFLCPMYLPKYGNTIITIYGRAEVIPCPTLIFSINKNNHNRDKLELGTHIEPLKLIASGSVLKADAYRLNIKRKILTGSLMRIHKRRAIVRYMFFNINDTYWFQPIELQ